MEACSVVAWAIFRKVVRVEHFRSQWTMGVAEGLKHCGPQAIASSSSVFLLNIVITQLQVHAGVVCPNCSPTVVLIIGQNCMPPKDN